MTFPDRCSVCGGNFGRSLPSHWSRNKHTGTLTMWCPKCQQETTAHIPTNAELIQYRAFRVVTIVIIVVTIPIAIADLVLISAMILICLILFGGLKIFDSRS